MLLNYKLGQATGIAETDRLASKFCSASKFLFALRARFGETSIVQLLSWTEPKVQRQNEKRLNIPQFSVELLSSTFWHRQNGFFLFLIKVTAMQLFYFWTRRARLHIGKKCWTPETSQKGCLVFHVSNRNCQWNFFIFLSLFDLTFTGKYKTKMWLCMYFYFTSSFISVGWRLEGKQSTDIELSKSASHILSPTTNQR